MSLQQKKYKLYIILYIKTRLGVKMSIRNYYKEENSKLFDLRIEISSIDNLILKLENIKKEYKDAKIYDIESQIKFKYYYC